MNRGALHIPTLPYYVCESDVWIVVMDNLNAKSVSPLGWQVVLACDGAKIEI